MLHRILGHRRSAVATLAIAAPWATAFGTTASCGGRAAAGDPALDRPRSIDAPAVVGVPSARAASDLEASDLRDDDLELAPINLTGAGVRIADAPGAASSIEGQVTARAAGLDRCYAAGLVGEPALRGAFDLTFEVAADGVVIGAATSPGAGARGVSAVAGCVLGEVRTWRLGSSDGITRVRLPVELGPVGTPTGP